jgi:hypothetical protein
MKNIKYSIILLLNVICIDRLQAQCPGGQIELTVDVLTDNWGYECYWDITPSGNGCGNGTIGTFGNTAEVDCDGGGLQAATAGGYPDNSTTTELVGCLTLDDCFDINYIDDFGDGGADFNIYVNGVLNSSFSGSGNGNVFSFCATAPAQFDIGVVAGPHEYTRVPFIQTTNIVDSATVIVKGTDDLTNIVVTVVVKQGTTTLYTETSTGINASAGSNSTIQFSGFTPLTMGDYVVEYSVIMNETDENTSDNLMKYDVHITDTVYARDTGSAVDYIGIGAGEIGYLGNIFTLNDNSLVTSVSAMIDNTDAAWEGKSLTFEVFSLNGIGTPTTSLATASKIVSGINEWHTAQFSSPLDLPAGDYLFAVKEEAALQHQINYSDSIFTPGTVWVSWVSQPWINVENLGFDITFLIRPNLVNNVSLTEKEQSKVNIHPNPATNEITLSNIDANSSVEIHNLLGEKVHSEIFPKNEASIMISFLPKGVYTITIIKDEVANVLKFIKQ